MRSRRDLDATGEWSIASQSEVMEENGLRYQFLEYVKDMDFDLVRIDLVDEDAPVTDEESPWRCGRSRSPGR